MIVAGGKTYFLAHHSRFGRTALHKLANVAEFDGVITDAAPDPDSIAAFTQADLTLTVASSRKDNGA